MGAACSCSKTNDNIKDVVAFTSPSAAASQPIEGALATYKRDNAGSMHSKVLALYNTAITQLPHDISDIKLSACKTKDKDWVHVFYLFTSSSRIQRLSLWKVTISAASFAQLSTHLATMLSLEQLSLSDMYLSSLEVDKLRDGLKGLVKLKELMLSVNNLRAEQLQVLFPALQNLTRLEIMSLDENELGDKGAALIAELLEVLKRVRDISLKFNSIGHKGLKVLLPWIMRRPGLIVRLDGNDLSDEEYDELEQAYSEAIA
jgi:Ran GTPase-activating protein (RanGAP) involved in mRNA processing and transport